MTESKPYPFNPPEWHWWILRKGTHTAVCVLWNHPIGAEMRLDIDGEMKETKAGRGLTELLDAADVWKAAFIEKGWTA
jgi:hypothetical protein